MLAKRELEFLGFSPEVLDAIQFNASESNLFDAGVRTAGFALTSDITAPILRSVVFVSDKNRPILFGKRGDFDGFAVGAAACVGAAFAALSQNADAQPLVSKMGRTLFSYFDAKLDFDDMVGLEAAMITCLRKKQEEILNAAYLNTPVKSASSANLVPFYDKVCAGIETGKGKVELHAFSFSDENATCVRVVAVFSVDGKTFEFDVDLSRATALAARLFASVYEVSDLSVPISLRDTSTGSYVDMDERLPSPYGDWQIKTGKWHESFAPFRATTISAKVGFVIDWNGSVNMPWYFEPITGGHVLPFGV